MERLTAFEFIPASRTDPQLVRLERATPVGNELVLAVGLTFWGGVDLSASPIEFDLRTELVIVGNGVGKPYWNDEPVPWAAGFDPRAELRRIEQLRAAVEREVNRALLVVN